MIKVLFVCLGNICRSPMAEAIFEHEVKKRGLSLKISVDSAGTGNWHIGHPPHEGTRKLLDEKGISHAGLVARQIKEHDFDTFNYIIAMDLTNKSEIEKLKSEVPDGQVFTLLEFIPKSEIKEVPDPYYTGNFEEVFELVTEGCHYLLNYIIEKHLE